MRRFRFGEVPREFVVTLLAGLLGVLAFAAVASRGLQRGSVYPRLAQLIEVLIAAGTIAALIAAARRSSGRERRAWALLAATIACWFLGTSVYLVRGLVLNRYDGNHLGAEVFYVCALPLAFMGFWHFRRTGVRSPAGCAPPWTP